MCVSINNVNAYEVSSVKSQGSYICSFTYLHTLMHVCLNTHTQTYTHIYIHMHVCIINNAVLLKLRSNLRADYVIYRLNQKLQFTDKY